MKFILKPIKDIKYQEIFRLHNMFRKSLMDGSHTMRQIVYEAKYFNATVSGNLGIDSLTIVAITKDVKI